MREPTDRVAALCPQCTGAPCEVQAECRVCGGTGKAPAAALVQEPEGFDDWLDALTEAGPCIEYGQHIKMLRIHNEELRRQIATLAADLEMEQHPIKPMEGDAV